MKLIITNRKEFEEAFDSPNSKGFSSKEIHKITFQKLQKSLVVNNSIPLMILSSVDNGCWKDAEFRLQGYKEGFCFYEYYGVIS